MESAARSSSSPSKKRHAPSSKPPPQPRSSIKGQPGNAATTPLGDWTSRVEVAKNGSKATSAPASRKSSQRSTTSHANNTASHRPARSAPVEATPPSRAPFSCDVPAPAENRTQALLSGSYQQAQLPPSPNRLSLSDRTIETFPLVSPTPSPGRPKSNSVNVDSPARPPSHPVSTSRKPRTRNAFSVSACTREISPRKTPLKPSPPSFPVKTPPMAHLSQLTLASPVNSPSKAVARGERSGLTKPMPTIRRAPISRATITARSTFERPAVTTLFRTASTYSSATSATSEMDLERMGRAMERTPMMHRTISLESIPFATSASTSRSSSTSSRPSASEFENAEETQTQSSRASSTSSDRLSSAIPSPAREYFDKEPEPNVESISLDLSSTNLTSFPMYSLSDPTIFTHVTSLNLSHNALDATKYLDSYIFLPHLVSLSLVSAGLTTILPLAKHLSAPALKLLNISCHRLSGPVPKFRYYFPMLEEVIATDGWFDMVETRTLVGLKRLDLRNNCICEADVQERRGDWKVLGVEVFL